MVERGTQFWVGVALLAAGVVATGGLAVVGESLIYPLGFVAVVTLSGGTLLVGLSRRRAAAMGAETDTGTQD